MTCKIRFRSNWVVDASIDWLPLGTILQSCHSTSPAKPAMRTEAAWEHFVDDTTSAVPVLRFRNWQSSCNTK